MQIILAFLIGFYSAAALAFTTAPANAVAPVSWGIQEAKTEAEAVRLASAGWEPFAVYSYNNHPTYLLRRRSP